MPKDSKQDNRSTMPATTKKYCGAETTTKNGTHRKSKRVGQ